MKISFSEAAAKTHIRKKCPQRLTLYYKGEVVWCFYWLLWIKGSCYTSHWCLKIQFSCLTAPLNTVEFVIVKKKVLSDKQLLWIRKNMRGLIKNAAAREHMWTFFWIHIILYHIMPQTRILRTTFICCQLMQKLIFLPITIPPKCSLLSRTLVWYSSLASLWSECRACERVNGCRDGQCNGWWRAPKMSRPQGLVSLGHVSLAQSDLVAAEQRGQRCCFHGWVKSARGQRLSSLCLFSKE